MGRFDDDTLYQPGGTGLIKFPEQVFWSLQGDKQRAEGFRGAALQLKANLDAGNGKGVEQCSVQRKYDDGTVIDVRKAYNFYYLTIYSPLGKQLQPGQEPVDIPVLQPGQFYWVPGCVARYSFKNEDLQNEIYIKPGTIDPSIDTTNTGQGATFLSLKDAGLSPLLPSPDGSITREAKVCYLEGAETGSGYSGARLNMSSWHIPTSGAFSISALVRLRKPIEMDYSFTSKTKELDCGYTVWNPIKPRILTSKDGETWSAVCPGSAVPLIGWHIPSRFSKHWVRFTYPWPNYNNNFVSNYADQIGYREIGTVCDGEPLMASASDAASPYWDKVMAGEQETLSGEFQTGWEENAEAANAAPYASFCTFKVDGAHSKEAGTRVVASLSDGAKRYATVASYIYEYNGDGSVKDTILTLKDYQYKRYMTEAQPSLTFGAQPFPVSHPQGYMIGTNFLGLLWYNGNKILAGKVCDFETEYGLSPIVTNELEIGAWYHVCLTMDADGNCTLYLTKRGDSNPVVFASIQSIEEFSAYDGFGQSLKVSVAADDWRFAPAVDSTVSNSISQFEFSSYMDMTLLRFLHRALSRTEAVLLAEEAFGQAFVADDAEAGQLQGMGYAGIMV